MSAGVKPKGRQDMEEKSHFYGRRKYCRFCKMKDSEIDFKDAKTLAQFISNRGKILPRRMTGCCAKHQRAVAKAIKHGRTLSLLPYTAVEY